MANEEVLTTVLSLTNRPRSRKTRSPSPNQSDGKCLGDQNRLKRTLTGINRPLSKLPNLLSKANIYTSSTDSIVLKRHRSQPPKDLLNSSTSKVERQTTNISSQARFPTLYIAENDTEQKRISEFRRRQIYALNHLMRELEQEQFRKYCQTNNIGTNTNCEAAVNSNDDSKACP